MYIVFRLINVFCPSPPSTPPKPDACQVLIKQIAFGPPSNKCAACVNFDIGFVRRDTQTDRQNRTGQNGTGDTHTHTHGQTDTQADRPTY